MASSSSYWSLPRKNQIALLVLCRVTEPLAFTSISPYIYFMVRDFGYNDPSTISALVTLVMSSFAFGQALTGIFWGRFSDHLGRKPALLLGLIGTSISICVFGLSRNIYWAIAGRLLAGMLNGNVGVMRTIIAEIIGDQKEHQTRAFAILPMTFNIGTIVGPMVGGLLADPAHNYPQWFGNSKFLLKYPYILPNLFPIPLLLLAFILALLFIEETTENHHTALLPLHRDPGLKLGDWILNKLNLPVPQRRHHLVYDVLTNEVEEESLLESSASTISTLGTATPVLSPPKPVKPSLRSILTKPVRVTLFCFVALMLHCPSFLQLLPLFLSTPRMPDAPPAHGLVFNGGLGWSTARIGSLMSILGFTGILLQLVVYPTVANIYGNAKVHRLSLLAFPVAYFVIPFLSFTPESPALISTLLIIPVGMLVVLGRTFAIPPMTILMTNAAPSRNVLGTVHGLTHSVVSVARCLGPFLLGNLYSLGVRINIIGLAFWTMSAVVLVEIYVARNLREWGSDKELPAGPDNSVTETEESTPLGVEQQRASYETFKNPNDK